MIDLRFQNIAPVPQSHAMYQEYRVDLMVKLAREKLKLRDQDRLGPIAFVEALIETYIEEGKVAASTWRTYRHYIVGYLANLHDDEVSIAIDLLQAQKIGENEPSHRKEKEVTFEDLQTIITRLMKIGKRSDSKYALMTAAWLTATTLTGLRPTEWQGAELAIARGEQGQVIAAVLKVWNAKASDERSFGVTRKLHLSNLSPKNLAIVADFHAAFQTLLANGETNFETIYEGCRQQLIRTSKQLWGSEKSITLYSARHEFKERASKVMPWAFVSAAMGHKKKRSGSAYGSGRSSVAPKVDKNANIALPDTADVLKVMKFNTDPGKQVEYEAELAPTVGPAETPSLGM